MDESGHQAPYQDIIDSVNRTASRDYYDQRAPPSSSWFAPELHDSYAGANGPYNAPMVSIQRTPRTPAGTPTHAGQGIEMMSTPRGSLARTPSLHLQYGSPRALARVPSASPDALARSRSESREALARARSESSEAVARARSGTEDAVPLPARMPRSAGLPFPPSLTISTQTSAVPAPPTATGWTPRADPTAHRPETGFSSGVNRGSTPHSVPFMHQQLHQQHQVHQTPRGVASREGTPRNSSYPAVAVAAAPAVPSASNPAFPPALSVNTNAAPIVLRQQRVVPRAYSERMGSEDRLEEERNVPRAYSEKIRTDVGLEKEGHVSGLVRQFSGRSSGGTPTFVSGTQTQQGQQRPGPGPGPLVRRMSGAATTTALETRERLSERRPSQKFSNTEMVVPEHAEVQMLTHAQLLAGRLESPIAVAGFSPSSVNNNVNSASGSSKKENTSIKASGVRSPA